MSDAAASFIHRLCYKSGLSYRELSRRAGLHYTYVEKIMEGKRTPSVLLLQRLANAAEQELVIDSRSPVASRSREHHQTDAPEDHHDASPHDSERQPR